LKKCGFDGVDFDIEDDCDRAPKDFSEKAS